MKQKGPAWDTLRWIRSNNYIIHMLEKRAKDIIDAAIKEGTDPTKRGI